MKLLGVGGADGGKVSDLEALPRLRGQKEHHGGEAAVALDHDQFVAVLLHKKWLVRKVAAGANRHPQLIDGHLLPQNFEEFLLRRLAA